MSTDEIVKALRWLVKETEFTFAAENLNGAATLIESLQAEVAEKDAEIKRLNDEPPAYKFYYCESENSYLLGRRVGNFYYAHWHDGIGFVFDMSRYLPWGEHVVALRTAWKEHTYPSEPKEIDSSEWFKGFLARTALRLAAQGEGGGGGARHTGLNSQQRRNTMRLIDADALMETIQDNEYELLTKHNSKGNGMFTLGIQQAVDEAPPSNR